MTSITAQQTKLDLELVPKENRLDIGKCNGRIPRGLKPKEETFQVVLDALALTPCYPAFIITADVPRNLGHTGVINSLNDVVIDQMHQPWRTFAAIINRSLSGKTSGFDKLHFTYQIDNKVYKKQEKIKEASQIYGAVLPECLTSPEMKESKAYKTYLGHAIVKRSVKKSSTKPATTIVVREPLVETKSKGNKKEKVDAARGKGIELLSEVALTEKAQLKEVRKKSLRDFHKTPPSGSGTGPENLQESESESWGNDEDDNNNEQESSNEGSEQENVSEEQESDSEQDNESKDDEIESEGSDVEMNEAQQGNENLETTQEQVIDDAHVTVTIVTKKTKVPVTSSSRSYLGHAPTLLTIPVSVITESSPVYTNIPQSSQTFTFTPILTTPTPPPTIETTNPLSIYPDFASVFRFNDRITALEKEVVEIKKDPLHVTSEEYK
ncbi:hypothetical protein Tco_0631885 [Tanacetum coccineum]